MPVEMKDTEEGQKRNGWEDDVMRGADWAKKFIDFMLAERSQLYGTLIHMFIANGLEELMLPERAVLKEYGEKYYLLYHKDGDEFKLSLKEQTE
jgi:hypothetical protein